jgi:hypothetical protein
MDKSRERSVAAAPVTGRHRTQQASYGLHPNHTSEVAELFSGELVAQQHA